MSTLTFSGLSLDALSVQNPVNIMSLQNGPYLSLLRFPLSLNHD